jgi:hypothetical protein
VHVANVEGLFPGGELEGDRAYSLRGVSAWKPKLAVRRKIPNSRRGSQ